MTSDDTYARAAPTGSSGSPRAAGRRRRAGDRVAYLGPNHPAFVETMFATHALGGIFVPLNFRLAGARARLHARHSGAGRCWCTPRSMPRSVRPTSRRDRSAIAFAATDGRAPALARRRSTRRSAGIDPAFILYTSGTTGRPKGAILTHATCFWNCYNLLVDVDVGGDENDADRRAAVPRRRAEPVLCCRPSSRAACGDHALLGRRRLLRPDRRHGVTWMFGVSCDVRRPVPVAALADGRPVVAADADVRRRAGAGSR